MGRFTNFLIGGCLLLCVFTAKGNNIQISTVSVEDRDTVAGTAYIRFTLSWDHSWKDQTHRNWDAAWVFLKCYHSESRLWQPVYLTPAEGRPVATGGGSFMAKPHGIGSANVPMWSEFGTSQTDFGLKTSGVFIYRKDVGNGSNFIENISLQFNYREHDYLDDDLIQVSVYAIEMVYVPASSYFIGDGTSENALYMDGKNLIIKTNVPTGQQALMGKVTGEKGVTYLGTAVPDTFPKGYNAVYMMKYEITQHGYADFLNTLTPTQQASRTSVSPYAAKGTLAFNAAPYTSNFLQYRNYIRVRIPAEAAGEYPERGAVYGHSISGGNTDEQWEMENNGGNIACNFLNWDDGLAYLDWACLRPMTEMEFEKACRGIQFLRRGMAWGYQYGISANAKGFQDAGLPTEVAVDTSACYLEIGKAPWVMRVGAFAKDSTSRDRAGATYYGILNMSDNLWERCINVSTEAGRSFIPKDGDGVLDDSGYAQVDDFTTGVLCWPDETGGGFRGFQISYRKYAEAIQTVANEGKRNPWSGFRGCRYPPAETKFNLDL